MCDEVDWRTDGDAHLDLILTDYKKRDNLETTLAELLNDLIEFTDRANHSAEPTVQAVDSTHALHDITPELRL